VVVDGGVVGETVVLTALVVVVAGVSVEGGEVVVVASGVVVGAIVVIAGRSDVGCEAVGPVEPTATTVGSVAGVSVTASRIAPTACVAIRTETAVTANHAITKPHFRCMPPLWRMSPTPSITIG
jgi:hypothetical protein